MTTPHNVDQAARGSIWFVLVVVMLDVLGIGLIIPVLPSLVRQFTEDPQAQSLWYGLLATAYSTMQFLAAPALGALSDRYGRRPVLLVCVFGLGIDFLLLALAPDLKTLLLARCIGGVTGASFAVCSAYLSDVSSGEERLKAFGFMGAVFGVGFVVGPALGGFLGAIHLRLPFYLASGLALLNGLYGYFVLPEPPRAAPRPQINWRAMNPFATLIDLFKIKNVAPLVWVFVLTTLGQFTLQSTLLLYNQIRFDWGPLPNGIAMVIVGLCAIIMQGFLLAKLAHLWGETRTIVVGLCSAIVTFLAYGIVSSMWALYFVIFANLLYFGVSPTLQAIISTWFGKEKQGAALGTLQAISSLMGVLGPLLGTQLLAQASRMGAHDWQLGLPFYAAGALQIAALVIMVRFQEKFRATMAPVMGGRC